MLSALVLGIFLVCTYVFSHIGYGFIRWQHARRLERLFLLGAICANYGTIIPFAKMVFKEIPQGDALIPIMILYTIAIMFFSFRSCKNMVRVLASQQQ